MVTNNEQDSEREVEAPVHGESIGTSETASIQGRPVEHRAPSANISLTKRLARFWQEAMVEWKKISFPDSTPPWKMKAGQWGSTNKGELYKLTIGVFVISIVLALVIGFMDIIVGLAYRGLGNIGNIFAK